LFKFRFGVNVSVPLGEKGPKPHILEVTDMKSFLMLAFLGCAPLVAHATAYDPAEPARCVKQESAGGIVVAQNCVADCMRACNGNNSCMRDCPRRCGR
jgi:hypothetical protein